jgi:hypothetical protein
MKNQDIESCYTDKPSYISIHIQNIKTQVTITSNSQSNLCFKAEFIFNGKLYKKDFEPILSSGKIYSLEEIQFDGIELHDIDRNRIADCLNKRINYHLD